MMDSELSPNQYLVSLIQICLSNIEQTNPSNLPSMPSPSRSLILVGRKGSVKYIYIAGRGP